MVGFLLVWFISLRRGMGCKVVVLWYVLFLIGVGVFYFYFVLFCWFELMGDIGYLLGIGFWIVMGVLVGLVVLLVVFILLCICKLELGIL